MPESTRLSASAPARPVRRSTRAELRPTRRRRSAELLSDGVVAAYIHELSERHGPRAARRSASTSCGAAG